MGKLLVDSEVLRAIVIEKNCLNIHLTFYSNFFETLYTNSNKNLILCRCLLKIFQVFQIKNVNKDACIIKAAESMCCN